MAIALQPRFPSPNRSRQSVRHSKDADGVIDIGWCDGVLSDGRAFRAEMWAQDQVSMLTFYFSAIGMEELDQASIQRFIENEALVSYDKDSPRYCSSAKYVDDNGSDIWSVNLVVGDDETTFLMGSIPIFPYSRVGEPNTMFNSVPIKAAHVAPKKADQGANAL